MYLINMLNLQQNFVFLSVINSESHIFLLQQRTSHQIFVRKSTQKATTNGKTNTYNYKEIIRHYQKSAKAGQNKCLNFNKL
jgi:hypothetical protein